jgi:REP element-mobilizing transposase RayT
MYPVHHRWFETLSIEDLQEQRKSIVKAIDIAEQANWSNVVWTQKYYRETLRYLDELLVTKQTAQEVKDWLNE